MKKTKANINMKALIKAKPVYKARGDADHCGDWLAKLLKDSFHEDGKKNAPLIMDDFVACLKENNVKLKGKWAENRNPGWQGRFRMNGRQKLERVIAETGALEIDGKKHKAPNNFIKIMTKRHPAAD